MATATTRSDFQLPPLTSFLTLAPTTSACYPSHRRDQSLPISDSTASPTSTAVVVEETAVIMAPVIPTNVGDNADLKLRRSSSMSSDGSLKTFRFLRLGPVHHGEQDGDWSEEVAVVE